MSGPAQKPYLKTMEHYSRITENQRFSEISVFPQTRIKKAFCQLRTWLSIWWTYLCQSRIWKQSSVSCKKPKANYFLKSLFIRNESGFASPNSTNFSWTSERAEARCSKTSNRFSGSFEDENTFWKCRYFIFDGEKTVEIVLIPRKIW